MVENPNLEVIDLNGRVIELMEINQALTQRCAGMRGQIVLKDTEISRLNRELADCRAWREQNEAKIPKATNGDATDHMVQ